MLLDIEAQDGLSMPRRLIFTSLDFKHTEIRASSRENSLGRNSIDDALDRYNTQAE